MAAFHDCSDRLKRKCVAQVVVLGRSMRERMIGDEGTSPEASPEPWRFSCSLTGKCGCVGNRARFLED